jgi:hypothetical protein
VHGEQQTTRSDADLQPHRQAMQDAYEQMGGLYEWDMTDSYLQ